MTLLRRAHLPPPPPPRATTTTAGTAVRGAMGTVGDGGGLAMAQATRVYFTAYPLVYLVTHPFSHYSSYGTYARPFPWPPVSRAVYS